MIESSKNHTKLIKFIDELSARVWRIRSIPEDKFDAFNASLENGLQIRI